MTLHWRQPVAVTLHFGDGSSEKHDVTDSGHYRHWKNWQYDSEVKGRVVASWVSHQIGWREEFALRDESNQQQSDSKPSKEGTSNE